MTTPTPLSNEGLSQRKTCIHKHEETYLVWHYQADGYSYFKCGFCDWQKPDLELGTVGRIIKAKDTIIAEREAQNKALQEKLKRATEYDPVAICDIHGGFWSGDACPKCLQARLKDAEGLVEALRPFAEHYDKLEKELERLAKDCPDVTARKIMMLEENMNRFLPAKKSIAQWEKGRGE